MLRKPRRNVVIPTSFGMMIINRFDYNEQQNFSGVGHHLLNSGVDNEESIFILYHYLQTKTNPIILDIGANIGAFAVQASYLTEQKNGFVYSFEPQRQIFQMLCGNVALNNCDNVYTIYSAVGSSTKPISIPKLNYYKPASFGSVSLDPDPNFDDVGQDQDFGNGEIVSQIRIDDYFKDISNIDVIKIDVEGMESDVLRGSLNMIQKHRPLMYIEWYKSDKDKLKSFIESLNYRIYELQINFICIPIERENSSEFTFLELLKGDLTSG